MKKIRIVFFLTSIACFNTALGTASDIANNPHEYEEWLIQDDFKPIVSSAHTNNHEIGITGAYFKNTTDQTYDIATNGSLSGSTSSIEAKKWPDGFHGAYGIYFKSFFQNPDSLLTLKYDFYQGTDNDNFADDFGNHVAKNRVIYHNADITYGKFWRASKLTAHWFGGIHLAHYNMKLNSTPRYSIDVTNLTTQEYKMRFSGAGPMIGANLSYPIQPNFKTILKLATSLVLASEKRELNMYNVTTDNLNISRNYPASFKIMPYISAALGLNYGLKIKNSATILTEIGYKFSNYFNASYTNQVDAIRENITTGNICFHGPYLTIGLAL